MNNKDYQHYLKSVLNNIHPVPPYVNADYIKYVRLNWFRQQRWLKNGVLNENLSAFLKNIHEPQKWIFITEPWCGDAVHILPFILKLLADNAAIELDIQLRDSSPFTIEQYLSGKSKSIPKLIVRNKLDQDLFVWGPRPRECQKLYNELRIAGDDYEHINLSLQNWYNQDKGISFQLEILQQLKYTFGKSHAPHAKNSL
jgi:hypothetical protein